MGCGVWGVGCGVWGSGEVGKWGSGEVGKWGSCLITLSPQNTLSPYLLPFAFCLLISAIS
ncbi:hypothetical protein N0824_02554 [Microcystis sp. 0824]|nr:hypothetical protein N0824_02554 [Microcystis sp. 0824]